MKHVTLRSLADLDTDRLAAWVRQAVALNAEKGNPAARRLTHGHRSRRRPRHASGVTIGLPVGALERRACRSSNRPPDRGRSALPGRADAQATPPCAWKPGATAGARGRPHARRRPASGYPRRHFPGGRRSPPPDSSPERGEPMNTYWHPFADMSVVKSSEIVIERGEGSTVWDTKGKSYLDAAGSLWYCNVGYGRDEIVDAVAEPDAQLPTYSNFGAVHDRAHAGPRRAPRRAGADPRRGRVLHVRRLRVGGLGRQARPSLLGPRRQAREADHRQPPVRLPRDERLRHVAGRHPRQPGRLRRHRSSPTS